MCRRVECPRCGRPTFAGCGAHVEQVLGGVPPAERCRCREDAASTSKRATLTEASESPGPLSLKSRLARALERLR
jgi:hypothetical protein